jgi:hypothetical protein
MKILRIRKFYCKFGKEDIFNPTTGKESLHEDSNDNSVRIVNYATSNILALRAEFYRTGNFISTPGPVLTATLTTKFVTY